jgi:hypothetical protein
VHTDTTLSRREATLRSAATTSLAGIALVQALELPPLLVQGRQLAFLSLAAVVLCVGLGWSLATAPADAAARIWRVVAASAALVLAGWTALHAFGIPGLASDRGHWGTLPSLVCAGLAAVCLALAIVAAPPTRATARGLATALAVTVALTPPVAIALVGLGPGTAGGEAVLASGGHIHSHGSPENSIVFQPFPGGHGGHYVYKTKAVPHYTSLTFGLLATALFVFTYFTLVVIRRRREPSGSLGLAGIEGKLA